MGSCGALRRRWLRFAHFDGWRGLARVKMGNCGACFFSGWGILGNFGECVECGTETLRHRGELDEVGLLLVRILCLLQDQAAMRFWDLARAAKAEKVGFWAGIEGCFFIFGVGGRCARWGIWAFTLTYKRLRI